MDDQDEPVLEGYTAVGSARISESGRAPLNEQATAKSSLHAPRRTVHAYSGIAIDSAEGEVFSGPSTTASGESNKVSSQVETSTPSRLFPLARPLKQIDVPVGKAKPLLNGNIRLEVVADKTFSSYQWLWGVECDGQVQGALNIPESGLHGTDLGNGLGTLRFGKVADPQDAARSVLVFRANMHDGYAAGAPRCEMTFSPSFGGSLPVNQDVWFAFGVRLNDWVVTNDEQILMQWHWSNGSIPLGPFLALSLKGNSLKIDSKYNPTYPPSMATSKELVHWRQSGLPINRWTYFVIKARISTNIARSPYLKVWCDGVQIVDYKGPLGYNYPDVTPYLKIGHYQWVASYNQWSAAAATKTVLYRSPALVDDPAGNYTEADLRAHVMAR